MRLSAGPQRTFWAIDPRAPGLGKPEPRLLPALLSTPYPFIPIVAKNGGDRSGSRRVVCMTVGPQYQIDGLTGGCSAPCRKWWTTSATRKPGSPPSRWTRFAQKLGRGSAWILPCRRASW